MRILMLGNSLTLNNDMPQILAESLNAEVIVHARRGARLAEQTNPKTRMGGMTLELLQDSGMKGEIDYVILQEMSHGPATYPDRYLDSMRKLTEVIRRAGARPVIYGTWAFRPDCGKLTKIGLDTMEMHAQMQQGFEQAVKETDALFANVGEAFHVYGFTDELYARDGVHPSKEGSQLAAAVLTETIRADASGADPLL